MQKTIKPFSPIIMPMAKLKALKRMGGLQPVACV
jgi:hypothetical protein